jgi:hypothetical protein
MAPDRRISENACHNAVGSRAYVSVASLISGIARRRFVQDLLASCRFVIVVRAMFARGTRRISLGKPRPISRPPMRRASLHELRGMALVLRIWRPTAVARDEVLSWIGSLG